MNDSPSGPKAPPGNPPELRHPAALRAWLNGLDTDQAASLRRRLGLRPAPAAPVGPALDAIPHARPLQIAGDPPVSTFPASRGQQRLFFLQALAPESSAYAVPVAFHLRGSLQVRWLEDALQAVIRRHDALRTTFSMGDSGIVQQVAANLPSPLEHDSLEAIPDVEFRERAEDRLREAILRPFDLETGPLIRVVLFRIRPEEHLLLVVLHHIISDGWSRANLLRDLATAYAALVDGRPAGLPPLGLQPADVSAWQTALEEGGGLARQEAHWIAALSGSLTPLDLPADRPRPPMPSFRGDCRRRVLSPGLRTRLAARAAEEGSTLFMLLLAAYAVLLRRETGRSNLVVGTPIAGRSRVELEPLIGFFVNTLPLPIAVPDDGTVRTLLRAVRDTVLDAHAHPDVPFDRLLERLSLPRDLSRHPLVSVCFAVRSGAEAALNLPGIVATEWAVNTRTAKFDFLLTVEESNGEWTAVAEYATDLFEASRVDRLLADWEALLGHLAGQPDQSIAELLSVMENPGP